MKFSYYETSPQRFEPEFVGVASRYFHLKKQRLAVQKRRKELDCDCLHSQHVDHQLNRKLLSKTMELSRLKLARQRQEEESQQKRRLQQARQRELEQLKQRNTHNRLTSRQKIEAARSQVLHHRQQSQVQLKLELSRLSEKFEHIERQRAQRKTSTYLAIKEQKVQAQQKVDHFHRTKNQQSLNDYLQRIQLERRLKRENDRRAKMAQRALGKAGQSLDTKKQCLQQLDEEISRFRITTKSTRTSARKQNVRRLTEGSSPSNQKIDIMHTITPQTHLNPEQPH